MRNVAAALSCFDDDASMEALEVATGHTEPLVREQAHRSLEAVRQRKQPNDK